MFTLAFQQQRINKQANNENIQQVYLCASFVGAVAAICGSKTKAAGASFRVGGVQVKCADSALIASRTLDVLLQVESTAR